MREAVANEKTVAVTSATNRQPQARQSHGSDLEGLDC